MVTQSKLINKNVGIVWHGHFPWNRGVGRLSETLHNQGWRVILMTRNLKSAPSCEKLSYTEVIRVPHSKLGKLGELLYYHLPISPIWFSFIHQTAKREGISLLIVRDLPLALVTGCAAKMLKIPAVFDMREDYPAFVSNAPNKEGIRKITKSRYLNEKLETLCLRFFDRIFVVVPEVKNKLVRKGYDPARIEVFRYLPKRPNLDEIKKKKAKIHQTLQFVYAGATDQRRDLLSVIKAFSILKGQGYNFRLTIVGDQSPETIILKSKSKELRLSSNVIFRDLFPPNELMNSLKNFDVGIINHIPSEHTENTLPMKLFEYMAAGLAIAASNIKPIRRIIDQEQCGLIFPSSEHEKMASTLARFILDRALTRRLGENAFNAVLAKYNWEAESKILIDGIAKLLNNNIAQSP